MPSARVIAIGLAAPLLLLALLLAPAGRARAAEAGPQGAERAGDCRIEAGPHDRVAQDRTLVIGPGEVVEGAVAVRGDVVVEQGATVERAVAVGGSVVVRSGATVRTDAVALGGDVRLEGDARVGKDAVALGGKVDRGPEGRVGGSVVGLSVQLGGSDLARKVLDGVKARGTCLVVEAHGG
jgi:NDP-sugar pyrophosphorylase family protein